METELFGASNVRYDQYIRSIFIKNIIFLSEIDDMIVFIY